MSTNDEWDSVHVPCFRCGAPVRKSDYPTHYDRDCPELAVDVDVDLDGNREPEP